MTFAVEFENWQTCTQTMISIVRWKASQSMSYQSKDHRIIPLFCAQFYRLALLFTWLWPYFWAFKPTNSRVKTQPCRDAKTVPVALTVWQLVQHFRKENCPSRLPFISFKQLSASSGKRSLVKSSGGALAKQKKWSGETRYSPFHLRCLFSWSFSWRSLCPCWFWTPLWYVSPSFVSR